MALVNPFIQRIYSNLETIRDSFNIELDLLLGTDKKGFAPWKPNPTTATLPT